MKKKVMRCRASVETRQDEAQAKVFARGFSLGLILLCQDETGNSSAQEIIEMRCKDVFEGAGYSREDLARLGLDPEDEATLDRIFENGKF